MRTGKVQCRGLRVQARPLTGQIQDRAIIPRVLTEAPSGGWWLHWKPVIPIITRSIAIIHGFLIVVDVVDVATIDPRQVKKPCDPP